MARLQDRLRHAWNVLTARDIGRDYDGGVGYGNRPDRVHITRGAEQTLVAAIENRIAIDAASIAIQHARVDYNGRYLGMINSGLNDCLTCSANKDQSGRAFIQDVVMSMLDEGCVAIVPVDTDVDPRYNSSYEIHSLRVGKIVEWKPDAVRVRLYNDRTGLKEEVTLPKSCVAIVENPLYPVMNEPNSTLRRLIRKMSLLDMVDEQSSAGKLDLIIQLPYTIKTQARQQQAEKRRKDIEMQLSGTKYGIAYTDATEKITQLNRPVENNLMQQIEYLTKLLYSQLGLTEEVFNGTADEKVMLNYNNRTIEPIMAAITNELKRKFLTKTARTQGQSIVFIRNPFALTPIADLASMADIFTRNEIVTPNELRAVMGFIPSDDPRADKLLNRNNIRYEDDTAQPAMDQMEQPTFDGSQQDVPPEYAYPPQDDYLPMIYPGQTS